MSAIKTSPKENGASVRDALTYEGKALRAIALPLGGIGAGTVALAGDGGLRQWQIVNNVNHDAHIPNSFFAIWAGGYPPMKRAAVVLQNDALYDDAAFQPAPSVSDHLTPGGSRRMMAELPGVDDLRITAQYPIVEVEYDCDALPVQVSLEAFSPFIPLNSVDSGLPAVIFNFTVTNPNDQTARVSLMGAQQNLVGWDGKTTVDGVRDMGYGGNVNRLTQLAGVGALDMSNTRLRTDHPANGQLVLAVLTEEGDEITSMLQWESSEQLWDHFSRSFGKLPNYGSSGASPEGQTWNGALAVHFDVQAGASRTVSMVLAWHFPNRYVTWDQENVGVLDRKSHFWIGNQYSNQFDSALAVVQYIRQEYARLVDGTRLYRDRFFESTLPWELLESVAGPISTIRTPTCIWNEDGRFHGFEGCHGASTFHGDFEGCCPMNCTHVWNYEMALAKLFPNLEQGMRHTDLIDQISPRGEIPHRTPLPLYLPRPWDQFIGGPRNPAMDGEFGTVLKAYREVRHGAGRAWFDEMWPSIKQLMQHALDDYDTEGDGVIRGEQPNTYDISIYGPNTFMGSLYLAALRSAEEMAVLQGEDELAQQYRARFELGRVNYDRLCWNGEYYAQIVDMDEYTEQQFGDGCHIDQLLGQWWAFALNLGYVLPEEHVRTTIGNIFRFNRRTSFNIEDQKPRIYMDQRDRGIYICTWPNGGKPEIPTQYSDEVWSGLEYPLASMLLHEGDVDAALTILGDIRERHNGARRSPWNEIECGDHYVRPMASWTLMEEAVGLQYDAVKQRLSFAPKFAPEDFRAFYVVGSGWGAYRQDADQAQVSVDYGELTLSDLSLQTDRMFGEALVDGLSLNVDAATGDGTMDLHFEPTLALAAGKTLTVVYTD